MSVLHFDKEATERLIAVYVTPDVVAQRNQFRRAFGARPGERVLDVGSGPGFLASAIAEALGGDRAEYFFSLNRYLFPASRP